jgi:hypothetical protein
MMVEGSWVQSRHVCLAGHGIVVGEQLSPRTATHIHRRRDSCVSRHNAYSGERRQRSPSPRLPELECRPGTCSVARRRNSTGLDFSGQHAVRLTAGPRRRMLLLFNYWGEGG